jgi:hypothetical protein
MTTFTLSRAQSFEVPQRTTIAVRLSPVVWNTALIAIAALFGVWYLVQVNLNMSKNFQVNDLQNQLAAVQTVEHANEIKLTQSETVSNLTAQAASLGMVPVGSVEYISRPSSGVALR